MFIEVANEEGIYLLNVADIDSIYVSSDNRQLIVYTRVQKIELDPGYYSVIKSALSGKYTIKFLSPGR